MRMPIGRLLKFWHTAIKNIKQFVLRGIALPTQSSGPGEIDTSAFSLTASPTGQIALQTRKGSDIPNEQVLEVSQHDHSQARELRRRWSRLGTIVRADSTPIYNCHGLTFASRRTGIHDVASINEILSEDEYGEVTLGQALPGDLVLYFSDEGDIEHSAILVTPPQRETLMIPKVLSKWGKFWEVIHNANDCPYNFGRAKFYRIAK